MSISYDDNHYTTGTLSDMIEDSYRSWDLYTTGQLVDGLQQKKENQFSLNGNGIMSDNKGWQFYRSTLYIYMKATSYGGMVSKLK